MKTTKGQQKSGRTGLTNCFDRVLHGLTDVKFLLKVSIERSKELLFDEVFFTILNFARIIVIIEKINNLGSYANAVEDS